MTRPALLQVSQRDVTVTLPSGKRFAAPVTVRHRMEKEYGGFADPVDLLEQEPIRHSMTVSIDNEMLEFAHALDDDRKDVEVEWEDLESLVAEVARVRYAEDQQFEIAKLGIQEFPCWVHYEYGGSWREWLDAMDGETAWVGSIADEILRDEEADSCFRLLDGGLFYIRNLTVHPAFQGQRIGLRLLAHSLWALHRSAGDTAIALVAPIENCYAPGPPRVTDGRGLRHLARHYGALGFRPVNSGQPPLSFDPEMRAVPIFLHFGEGGLPVYGLGTMGRQEPRKRRRQA